jgi:hypothetical protein
MGWFSIWYLGNSNQRRIMAKASRRNQNKSLVNGTGKKCTSQGVGGRGRRVKVGMSTMNKSKKRSTTVYRGQGR